MFHIVVITNQSTVFITEAQWKILRLRAIVNVSDFIIAI